LRNLFKKHIVDLERYQTSIGRDLEGLRLDRNERVDPLPQHILDDIFSTITPSQIAAHPESAELQGKVSRFLGVPEEQIYLVNGVTEGINYLLATLCSPGDNVVVLDPTYPMYRIYARLHGLDYRALPYGDDLRPDLTMLEQLIDDNTRMLVIANPNLPVESAFGLDDVRKLAELCLSKGCALIVDEAYHHFGADTALPLLDEFDNIVLMRTFSKAFGLASMRIGYMISTAENIAYLSKTRSIVESSTLSMAFAGYMLDNIEIMQAHVADVKDGARFLQQAFDERGLRWHGGNYTNGILVFLDARGDANDLIRFMRDRNIYVRGAFSPPFDNCARVSIGSEGSMQKFVKSLDDWLESNHAARSA